MDALDAGVRAVLLQQHEVVVVTHGVLLKEAVYR